MKKIIAGIIVIIALFLTIRSSYAYYVDQVRTDVNYDIASWVIKVNDNDITKKETEIFEIEKINWDVYTTEDGYQSSNGKLAPGMKGKFNIIIDASETNVAFNYLIEMDRSNIINDNIVIKSVTLDGDTVELTDNQYSNIVELNDNKLLNLEVEVEWIDSLDNNDIDTETGSVANRVLPLPVKITFEQVV